VAALSVRVLGEFSIDGIDVRTLADRKARLMLRWLALARGRPVAAGALVDALWGAAPPSRPGDQVAVLASRLRRELGREAIEHGDHGYRLAYDWLDLDELERVLAEAEQRRTHGNTTGAVAAARIALALVRGALPDPATDAEWVLAEQAVAERLVRRAHHVAASAMLDNGDWLDALDLASATLQANAYDEDAVRLVMRANVLGGRPALALAAYAELRAVLGDDLGTEPAPETSALHTAVLRGEVLARQPAPSRPPVRLVGRTAQLRHLDTLAARLTEGRVRVALVTGEAGIGKTTLLRAWSDGCAEAGRTVLFATCGPLERSAPLDVLLVAIGDHLRRSDDAASLLGEDAALLAPLLGPTPAATSGRRPVSPVDPVLGAASLYAAVTGVLGRIAGEHGVILVIDDAHLAGPALTEWLLFTTRRPLRLLVVAGTRPSQGGPFAAGDTVNVGPLDRAATAELVGAERADDLFARSGGNPLFLSELARTPTDQLPPSLVDAVGQACDQLGGAAALLRTAAVLGTDLDIDLLASVVGRPALDVLADVELAEAHQLLVEESGRYRFRHDLVRDALTAGTRTARTALLHREAAAALGRRPDADPMAVADHARLGGDLPVAARALRVAAARAAERFDHEVAEDLLDQSLRLAADDATLLARARVRIRRERYDDAESDVAAASTSGAEGSEVGAWAAYFDRRFDDAVRYAQDGELAADDPVLRARCLMVGGRTLHARGDLAAAEARLSAAVEAAVGPDRLTAAAWWGVLMSHRSETDRAIGLLRPATHPTADADQTSALLHALLFTGHAHALAGRPAAALDALGRYTAEVDRRQVPRFAGRGVNFSGWVLRNVGATDAAREAHQEAWECTGGVGTAEMRIAVLEDLAEDRLLAGDPDGADRFLAEARAGLVGDLVFGWRLAMKHALLRARADLLSGAAAEALDIAATLRDDADRVGVPRYASVARLLVHQAHAALGEPVDPDVAWRDLAAVEDAVAVEAWWWAGETGAALGQPRWLDRAEALASGLADASGQHGDALRTEAGRRLTEWRLRLR
jgi:DNA-binding SARP family transcriptional activator